MQLGIAKYAIYAILHHYGYKLTTKRKSEPGKYFKIFIKRKIKANF